MPAAPLHSRPSGATSGRARPATSTSAIIVVAARVEWPEGKEFVVGSMPGPSTSRLTSRCLITWVVRFAPSTSEASGSSSAGRRRSSAITAVSASRAMITGMLTVSTASSAIRERRPSWFREPERVSWSSR